MNKYLIILFAAVIMYFHVLEGGGDSNKITSSYSGHLGGGGDSMQLLPQSNLGGGDS